MNSEQYTRYLSLIDFPTQLTLSADEHSLYHLYRRHITRFPYQNIDLYNGAEVADLDVEANLKYMSEFGGHCYQHSELLLSVLNFIGFNVSRIPSWVLMGKPYVQEMPVTHNILLVTINNQHYLCDPGFASASPRCPLRVNLNETEEFSPCEGDHYKLEVASDHYNLHWIFKGEYLLLYRFSRDNNTNHPVTCDRSKTLEMCYDVYTVPYFINIRDKYIKVSRQTDDGVFSFLYVDGIYNFKFIRRGKSLESKDVDFNEFCQLLEKHCYLKSERIKINSKKF